MKLTVVIPTYNRFEILKRCLDGFEKQTMPREDFEVIVVDDGSTDRRYAELPNLVSSYSFQSVCIQQSNSGPSKARNQGIAKARGKVVVLIGDDILVPGSFAVNHYEFHADKGFSRHIGIGEVIWDPEMEITPFMEILDSGIQFSFRELKNRELNYRHCYTANVSFVREAILEAEVLFSEHYTKAAYEDIEWGYRLHKKGFSFSLCDQVRSHHHHQVTLQGYAERMIEVGKAYVQTCILHPEYGKLQNKGRIRFMTSALKNEYRFFILKRPRLYSFFKKWGLAGSEEKWVKGVLGYYQDIGIRQKIAEKNQY